MTFRISSSETPNQTISLINVKSYNALLRMLPVCIGSCLKSGTRYTFIISDNPDTSDTLCLCEQGHDVRICGHFFEDKGVRK